MVLLAGVVVALALVAMLVAYLQLGYHADVRTASVDGEAAADGRSYLQRTTHETSRALRGEFTWSDRGRAVTEARNRLQPRIRTLQRSRVEAGIAYTVEFNRTAAQRWATANCPSGSGREFGPCAADRGVVVQERGGRSLLLAVGYDLTVTTDRETVQLTVVAPAVK
ncbi:hypothetical protein HZS54_08690 [Halosimplex pelagicum]|uniref:Uncharacterized protein n=2 Tax=Halosimplex pelagicum TaxID=869886 RepID=A0A7D5TCV2_9EURY|nr:hypothetical protein HZS54_08690 [Halosimplex pelagicum]